MPEELFAHPDLARIRLLCCDVDGVLTDGGLYYADDDTRFVRFHVLDGMGLKRVQAAGVRLAFISQSRASYIAARARDLDIDFCYTAVENKLDTMTDILSQMDFGLDAVAHIADDVNDLSLMRAVGLAITVPSAAPEVWELSRFVTRKDGGNGAVRELCEAILKSRSCFES